MGTRGALSHRMGFGARSRRTTVGLVALRRRAGGRRAPGPATAFEDFRRFENLMVDMILPETWGATG